MLKSLYTVNKTKYLDWCVAEDPDLDPEIVIQGRDPNVPDPDHETGDLDQGLEEGPGISFMNNRSPISTLSKCYAANLCRWQINVTLFLM